MAFQPVNSTVCFPGLLLPSETVFHNLCTVLYWRLCGLTNSPIVKYPLTWGWCAWSAEGSLKQWLPNGKLLLLSHKMSWCALLTAVKNYNKSLEKLQDFFFKIKTKTKSFIFVLEAPRDQDRGLEDYITGRIWHLCGLKCICQVYAHDCN